MKTTISRRSFLRNSAGASMAASLAFGFEAKNLLAQRQQPAANPAAGPAGLALPFGRIGKLRITRMIVGGNLTSGIAHSRDLTYVSSLMKNYFTEEKIFETWRLCEQNGINTAMLRVDNKVIPLINKYWKQGGRLQWIAQCKPATPAEYLHDARLAVDNGAVGAYAQGSVCDEWVKDPAKVELIGKMVEYFKANGLIAGIGGHRLEVPVTCERAGLNPDFYMKTHNSANYWTAGPRLVGEDWKPDLKKGVVREYAEKGQDNIWETTPRQTAAFMQTIKKPWIAFKVLGAGAIKPREGFAYAFSSGADFICVGMFDFQVVEDIGIARAILAGDLKRARPWYA